jgi:hypothetical protein
MITLNFAIGAYSLIFPLIFWMIYTEVKKKKSPRSAKKKPLLSLAAPLVT